jgi:predicted glycoside hydrolase/deacetylase ChbG (UPF0249 family)
MGASPISASNKIYKPGWWNWKDTKDLKSFGSNPVRVRVSPWARCNCGFLPARSEVEGGESHLRHDFMFREKNKNLILTADDFGKSAKANENILKLASAGKLDRVSVMIDGDLNEVEVKELLASNVKLDIHLELIWQKRRRNLLSDKTLRQGVVFFVNYIWGDWPVPENPRSGAKSVYLEWKKQIEKFRKIFGRKPDGISSHEHTHFFPAYFGIALDLGEHFSISFVRFGKRGFVGRMNSVRLVLSVMRWMDKGKFLKSGMESSKYFASLDWIGRIEEFMKNIPEGKIEVACHPERKDEFEIIDSNF